jgi:hypothetical protein
MVLQKQIVQLPFGGLQTKIDPKIAPIGTYEILDNWVMNRYPELVKRNGLNRIGITTVPSNINANYSYLNETGVITNKGLYAYSPVLDQFLSKGNTASPIITSTPVIANTYVQLNCDSSITTQSIQGSVWEDSRGGVRCSIQDVISDTFLTTDYQLSSTGIKPKVVAASNAILFLWCETSNTSLKCVQYNPITNTFGTITTINTVMSSTYTYDAILAVSNVLIASVTTGSSPNSVLAYYWSISNQAVGSPSTGFAGSASLSLTNAASTTTTISLAVDPTNTYFTVTWQNAAKAVYTKAFSVFFVSYNSELEVATATTDAAYTIASCNDAANNTYIFYSTYSSNYNTFKAVVSGNISSPTVASNASFILQLAVASKAIFFSGNAYIVLGYTSTSGLQNTFFGMRDDGACFARMFAQVAGGAPNKSNCVTSFSIRPDKPNTYVLALLKVTKIISSGNTLFLNTNVFSEQIYFTPSNIDNKSIGRLLNIAGGYLKHYDGSQTIFEQGFHLYPDGITSSSSTSGSPAIPNGTYSYVVCWEWIDNQGQLVRSTPSVPLTVTLSGGPSTVTVTIPCLPITNKETRFSDTRTNVIAALYRTQSGGTTYYRVNQTSSSYIYNNPAAASISVVDNSTDAQIAANILLYDTGGVFDNIVLPSTNLMCVLKNRVVVAGSDVLSNQVFFSKEKEEGIGIEFSNELSFIVDSLGGDITALAAMDDKLIIFKENVIYYVAGILPDKLGNGAAPYPLLVSTNCGCNYPQSIVLTGLGLMFQSPKGIYMIDRQLNVSYIGQQLDKYTTNLVTPLQITSAVNLTDQNQVVFTDINNQGFIYDTFFSQWYTQTYPFSPVAACVLNDSWYVSNNNQMFQQVKNQTFDNINSPIISRVKTNWISIGQLDGFARIFAILIYGSNASVTSKLKAKIYYDFEDYPTEQVSISPQNLADATIWGSDATWGASSPWGGTFDGSLNFMIRPKRQKCSAIKIEIYDEFPSGTTTQSFTFSGISLAIGVKPTWNKSLPFTRRLT